MIDENAKKMIDENPMAFSTVDKDGKPNVIGVAYVKIVPNNKLIITNNYMKMTIENIKTNPNVCLAVWDKDWNGYKIKGTAEYYETGEWLDFVKKMPENKGLPAKGAILIKIEEIRKLI